MSAKKLEAGAKEIAWPSVITVISAAILIPSASEHAERSGRHGHRRH